MPSEEAKQQPQTIWESLDDESRRKLYATSDTLDKEVSKNLGLYFPLTIYLQDPLVAKNDPKYGFSELDVKWEPGIQAGPTSSRFAVVDYNGDTAILAPPAIWDGDKRHFVYKDAPLDPKRADEFQFHQVNVWAHLQNALFFFEEGSGMGRRIPWGFEGNRLIIVPHAGYGKNAFYDRESKSLQFYYYEADGEQIYTCLSTDIIHHEFGHAVLDGVRPYFNESPSLETAAFHEFVGDIAAILLLLRNNRFRNELAEANKDGLAGADELAFLAEQFGKTVEDREYLRSARNKETMRSIQDESDPHIISEVLTGAMYDILVQYSEHYLHVRNESPRNAFWHSIQRMQRVVFQPLDLLPPVDVTFRDYALAVLRSEELSNPTDPEGYRNLMLGVFHERGILNAEDVGKLQQKHRLFDRFDVDVFHSIDKIARSRASAYRFLDDNRRFLSIPSYQDFIVADLYQVDKYSEIAHRLPRQYVLEYIWHEEVRLEGSEFGNLNGRLVTMPCGGTLVFDERGNVLSWFAKHGSYLDPAHQHNRAAQNAAEAGKRRLARFKSDIAHNIKLGQLGIEQSNALGLLGARMAPFITRNLNGTIHFKLSPHLGISGENRIGERTWQSSS